MSTIREHSVFADQKHSFLANLTRLEFVEHYIGRWFKARQFRGYALLAAIVGLFFLFSIPLVSMIAFAIAAYFHVMHKLNRWYTEGEYAKHRNLVLAD